MRASLRKVVCAACAPVAAAVLFGWACRGSRGLPRAAAGGGPGDASSGQRAVAKGAGDGALVPSCRAGEQAPPARGGTLSVLLDHEPPHLDPLDDPPRSTLDVVSGLVYEPLVECRGGEVRAALAERWEWAADGASLALQLRPGVRWHDGKPLTVADVQTSVEAFLGGRSRLLAAAAALADVRAVQPSAGAVRLQLTRPNRQVLAALCDVPIVPAAFARHPRNPGGASRDRPVGTGPMQFAGWDRKRQIRLTRSASSWRGAGGPEEVRFEVEPDAWRALIRARGGEVDLWPQVPLAHYPEQVRRAALAPGVDLRRLRGERYSFLALNHRHPALADGAVRTALSLLWNRAALAEEIHEGLAEPIAAPLGAVPPDTFDPRRAERTLAEAGWLDRNGDGVRERAGVPLRLTLIHAPAAGLALEVELRRFTTHLQRAGIRLESAAVEPGVLLQRLRERAFDLVPLTWRGRAGEDLGPLLGESGRFNPGGSRSPQVQGLLDELRIVELREAREALASRLARVIADELPAVFLYRHDDALLVSRRVRGLCSESGRLDLLGLSLEPRP